MPVPHAAKRTLWVKILLFLLAALVASEVIYVGVTVLVLNTPLLKKIVSLDPKETIITVRAGWSLFPGTFHIYDTEIQGQDENVKWIVKLPSPVMKISLNDLRLKTLHVTHISAEGISFKLDMKTPPEKQIYIAHESPDTSLEEKKRTHWKLLLDQVDLKKVESLQVAGVLYRGDAEIHGKLDLWPGIRAEIGPAELLIHSGNVYSTAEPATPLLENIQAATSVHFYPYSIDQVSGSEVFRDLDAAVSLQGKLDVTHHVLDRTLRVEGALQTALTVSKGIIQPTAVFSLASAQISSSEPRWNATAQGTLLGKILTAGDQKFGKISLSLDRFYFEDRELSKKLISGTSLLGSIESPDLDMRSLFENRHFDLSIPNARILSGAHWEKYLQNSPKFTVLAKAGTLSARIEATAGNQKDLRYPDVHRPGKDFVRLLLSQVHGKYKSADFIGNLQLTAKPEVIDLQNQKAALPSVLWNTVDANWKIGNENNSQWWLRGGMRNVSFDWSHSFSIEGKSFLSFKTMEPFLKIYRTDHSLSETKYLLLNLGPVKLSAQFSASPLDENRQLLIHPFRLDASPFHAHGDAQWTADGPSARIAAHYALISFGVVVKQSKTHFRLFPSKQWLKISDASSSTIQEN